MVSEGICYGQTDLAPDPLALEQLLHKIQREIPSKATIVSSPLQRCLLPAQRLPSMGFAQAQIDKRIAEFHFGHWEGRAWSHIHPQEREQWAKDRITYQVPGGESVEQLGLRACEALAHWSETSTEQHLAFVTHAGVIQVLLAHIREGDFRQMRNGKIEYGSITRLSLSR
jgi:alpha-ribazole phosphatase